MAVIVTQRNDAPRPIWKNKPHIVRNPILRNAGPMNRIAKFFAGPGSMESTSPHGASDDSCSPYSATIPDLPVLDEAAFEEAEATSFDPYNSGSFDSRKYKTG